uniref:Uncharacterized protein n=1 Tax=Heliothis virescens TaxID=7102 RepID=A0A2A4J673_HELVI
MTDYDQLVDALKLTHCVTLYCVRYPSLRAREPARTAPAPAWTAPAPAHARCAYLPT